MTLEKTVLLPIFGLLFSIGKSHWTYRVSTFKIIDLFIILVTSFTNIDEINYDFKTTSEMKGLGKDNESV